MTGREECPSAEEIARLLDGQVSAEERESIERHVVSCDRCYQVLIESTEVWWRLKTRPRDDDAGGV